MEKRGNYTVRKFYDPIDDILDRPIAFNPVFKKITGSTVAALMLSQAWYWSKRTSNEDGWFYKTISEWEEETGLTRSEQETARKHLKDILEVELRGVPATLYYRINKSKILELLGVQFAETLQTSLVEPSNQDSEIPANINRTENTTENTQKKGDLVDLELSKLPAMSIRKAISEYFKLNTNWDTKYNRQWMEWAVETGITAEQISRAADTWRTDKQFNWQVPTLKGIFEKWQMLMEASAPVSAQPQNEGKGFYV